MLAQGTARQSMKSTKYRPHVRIVNRAAGQYTVQSEQYTYVLYLVDVVRNTCECAAGQRGFKGVRRYGGVCKHMAAARLLHNAIEQQRQAA